MPDVEQSSSSDRLLALLDQLPPEAHQKGRAFERLCKWFLENAPEYRASLRRVWLWDEWPERWGIDAGIDLVAEARDGGLWAIQAKAFAPDVYVTKEHMDTFLSESSRPQFTFRLVMATTDRMGSTASRTLRDLGVGKLMRGDLLRAEVPWPASLAKLRPAAPKRKTARDHQKIAVADIRKGFHSSNRGQLVMACGTGKTLTSLFTAEALGARQILFLVPSLSLLSQVLHEWLANSKRPLEFLPVCSDESVVDAEKMDDFVSSISELALPATTDPLAISRFLRRSSGVRVVFATYQSSPAIAAAQGRPRVPAFDLVIADEAHRLAGDASVAFATVLHEKKIRGRRRLFMTATPKISSAPKNEKRHLDVEVTAMSSADGLFGPRFHTLTFGAAIAQKLLTDYQVAIMAIDDSTYLDWAERGVFVRSVGLRDMDARTLAIHVGLAKAFRKFDIRRAISFHSRISLARRFAESLPEVVRWLPASQRPSGALQAKFISGEMSAEKRRILLEGLRSPRARRALLANARCLTEGIDVPSLDAVAFVDPRRSEVDIVQAVGRAIRYDPNKKIGTVVIPVFVSRKGDTEAAIEDSAFRPVWGVLNALRAHDNDLATELDELRRGLGARRITDPRLPKKVYLDLPTWVTTDFSRSVRLRVVEGTTENWEEMFGALEAFVVREGHALVPQRHNEDGLPLGSWVARQRQARKLMGEERRFKLEALEGWAWHAKEAMWEEGYRVLLVYAAREGHALVPQNHVEDDFGLGQWVANQRVARSRMSASRRTRLQDVVGWSWDAPDFLWERCFEALLTFVDREGHARVPTSHLEGAVKLGAWVKGQRRSRRRLIEERRDRLESLPGWVWDSKSADWDAGYAALLAFVAREGHARVPMKHVEGLVNLGSWVQGARHTANAARRKKLNAVEGWVWDAKEAAWQDAYALLVAFVAREGHALVPRSHREGDVALGVWVQNQRRAKTRMPKKRRQRLEAIHGWEWDTRGLAWQKNYELLRQFVRREGHAWVPVDHIEGDSNLGVWVAAQRHARSRIDPDRKRLLEDLPGWTWNAADAIWEQGFMALLAYVKRVGDSRVPQKHVEGNIKLGNWVMNRRRERHRMSALRRQRLEELPGWEWKAKSGPKR